MDVLRIGTRKSLLAMIQTEIVADAIRRRHPELQVELVQIMTDGDRQLNRSLASFGGKGVFTRELEEQLLDGRIDLAVHSAKDMPMELPEGLCIGAVPEREDPRDVIVTLDGTPLELLPAGSIVGTSSLRRALQVKAINPALVIQDLRGNVQTRLGKLEAGPYRAIVLAAAGLTRLELEDSHFHFEKMSPDRFLPAAGQGILAVESRIPSQNDPLLVSILQELHDPEAGEMLAAERAFLRELSCGCNAPAAAYCRREGDRLIMSAMYARDGKTMVKDQMETGGENGTTAWLADAADGCEHGVRMSAADDYEEAARLGEAMAQKVRQGKVYLIGAGPGDAGLFTLKGMDCVRRADVIIYDNLIPDSILNEAREDARLIYAGKRAAHHHLKQSETNSLLVEEAKKGNMVVRLKGGDPLIFGRGGEEALELKNAGVEFEIVPGISSAYAVPAYGGIPVTHRDLASSFHVVTGHESSEKEKESVDYETLAKEEGTLLFLMGLSNLEQIAKRLEAAGKSPKTPVAVIQAGTTARQRMAVGTLADIADEVKRLGISSPAVTVVGETSALQKELSWFGKLPLSSVRILLTGTKSFVDRMSPKLEALGVQTVKCSLLRTRLLESEALVEAMGSLDRYRWLVLTSVNGVEALKIQLQKERMDLRRLAGIKFAVIGRGTAQALEQMGVYPDCVPKEFTSGGLAEELLPRLTNEDRVLLLRAREASPLLPARLEEQGVPYDDVALYCTERDERRREDLPRLMADCDYTLLGSGSAARALAAMLGDTLEGKRPDSKLVCIGPVTAKEAEKAGLSPDLTAWEASAEGICSCLLADRKAGEDLTRRRRASEDLIGRRKASEDLARRKTEETT